LQPARGCSPRRCWNSQIVDIIVPHFHEVDQFQVFVSGSGSLGRQAAAGPLAVHYADHHTGYGPINASAQGFSYFTLRARTDPGAVYLHKPGYRERLKPSKKRHGVADGLSLSTEPVLMSRKEIAAEKLLGDLDGSDGLAASLIRMGPGMTLTGPDPVATGGQHYLVVNGSLEMGGEEYAGWSTVFVPATDPALELRAGPKGLEVMLLQYPPANSVTSDGQRVTTDDARFTIYDSRFTSDAGSAGTPPRRRLVTP
jgi:hypothetical protein